MTAVGKCSVDQRN